MNLVAGAARLCTLPAFWRFLAAQCGQPVAGRDQAVDLVRRHCGITSRRELATDPAAGQAFIDLVNEFNAFQSSGADQHGQYAAGCAGNPLPAAGGPVASSGSPSGLEVAERAGRAGAAPGGGPRVDPQVAAALPGGRPWR